MSTEKNALRNKLDDFDYGYRDGAWERFEKMLGEEKTPIIPPVTPDKSSGGSFGKKLLGISLGLAIAIALLFAGWLIFKPYSGTGLEDKKQYGESAGQTTPLLSDQTSKSQKPTAATPGNNETTPTLSIENNTQKIDKQKLTKTGGDFKKPKSVKPATTDHASRLSKQSDDFGFKGKDNQGTSGPTRQDNDLTASSLTTPKSPKSATETPANVPADQVTGIPSTAVDDVYKSFQVIRFLPTLLENVDIQNDSLLPRTRMIQPFVETPLRWKKHEAGTYMDIAGPFLGNYMVGGEYTRNWNSFTQTGLGIGFQYIINAQGFNNTTYGAFATHFIATEYVSLFNRPKWDLRVGVGYRLSAIQPVRYKSSDPAPDKYAASDKKGLLFTAEYKRQLRNDTWLGLRFSALHWAPNLNLYLSRQF